MTAESPRSIRETVPAVTDLQAWLPALVAITVVCAVFGFAFQPEIVGAVRVWTVSLAYNYGFLILPLVAALVWHRRTSVASLQPVPAPWALALVPALSTVWLAA